MTEISHTENSYALIIGLSNYKDPRISKLNYTRADAEGIIKILTDPKKVGLKKDKIKILLDDEATRFNIEDAMSDWLFAKADNDSTVMIYFAGHGGLEIDRSGKEKDNLAKYLLPFDSIFGKLFATAISNTRFRELLDAIRCKKLVIFIDSNHSEDNFGVRARDIKLPDHPYENLAKGEGRVVIAASQPNQLSHVDSKLGHGIFAHHLIEALSGKADFNKDGYVTVIEVYNYLADMVPKTAMQLAGKMQNPMLTGNINKDFVLTIDHERLEELDRENRKNKPIDDLAFSALSLHNEGKYSEALNKWKEVLKLDSENEAAKEGIKKVKDYRKNRNLDRLLEWFSNGDLNDEDYELACRLVESRTDGLCDADIKVLKLLDGLLSDKISIKRFRNDVDRIRETYRAPIMEQKVEDNEIKIQKEDDERKNHIIELCSNALKMFDKRMYSKAIAKWEDVLKLDSVNRKAIEGIEEARKVLKELEEKKSQLNELNKSAKQSYDEGKYSDSINKWREVLDLDSENREAIDGIEISNKALIKIEENEEKKIKKTEVFPEADISNIKPISNAYGVVIGIGEYQDSGIPALKYARDDAEEIYNILTNPEYGNFPKENVKLLIDKEATLTNIKSAMGTFLRRNAGEDDMVCIYFAGHGSPELDSSKADDNLEKFLVPYDAKKDDLFATGFSMDDFKKIFGMIESKKVIFLIDSCYSGQAGGRTFSKQEVAARNISISEKFLEELSGEGRIIISASLPDELSFESDDLKHGIFTYYLAEGLKGKADLNKDGVVTVDELYKYVFSKVTEKARLSGGRQHPLKKGTIIGEIPLTHYETEKMRNLKEFHYQKKFEDALNKYEEIIKIDKDNSDALNCIEKLKKEVGQQTTIFKNKQRKLLYLNDEKGLPSREYSEAMIILKKNPSMYTEKEKKISRYVEELLKDEICVETYIDTRKLIEENPEK
jgi:uncharacterized caspase-like protein